MSHFLMNNAFGNKILRHFVMPEVFRDKFLSQFEINSFLHTL